jgi:predicted regulator of Ras-like GTPase activity (Roadblock/LC7/MglB family)
VTDDVTGQGLGWLVSNFVDRIPGASSAVVVSSDGLVLSLSEKIARDGADQMAAITSGLTGLTAGAARCFDAGQVMQVIVEMEGGYLFVTSVSDGSSLAVLCDPTCDIGLVGYEMSLVVDRIGRLLTPELIAKLQSTSLEDRVAGAGTGGAAADT